RRLYEGLGLKKKGRDGMNERLEDIINDLPYSIRHEGNVEALIDYAKEQAERLEELERELERIKVKYRVTKESHYNCSKSTSELEQQNERYRELIDGLYDSGYANKFI